MRLGHLEPVAIGLEAELQHKRRLALPLRNDADRLFAEPLGNRVRLDRRLKTVGVFRAGQLLNGFRRHARLRPEAASGFAPRSRFWSTSQASANCRKDQEAPWFSAR